MQPEWRVVAVVDTATGNDLIPLICSSEPHSYRCEQLECENEARDRWQVLVNFAEGEQAAGRSAKALLRTALLLTASHDAALEIRRGREWIDVLVHAPTDPRPGVDAVHSNQSLSTATPAAVGAATDARPREQVAG